MARMLLYGAGVDLGLDPAHLGLQLDKTGVVVVIVFDLGLQAPIAVLPYFVNDVGVRGCVSGDGLEEPGGDDVGGGFPGNGWLSVKLVEMDAVVGASERPLDQPRAG